MEQPKCLNSPEISLLVRIKRGQTNSVTEGVPGYKKKIFSQCEQHNSGFVLSGRCNKTP